MYLSLPFMCMKIYTPISLSMSHFSLCLPPLSLHLTPYSYGTYRLLPKWTSLFLTPPPDPTPDPTPYPIPHIPVPVLEGVDI